MTYSISSSSSYIDHLQTMSAIESSANQTRSVIHDGLMSLATSQANAMRSMADQIDSRISGVDTRIAQQSYKIDSLGQSLAHMANAISQEFENIGQDLSRMDTRLNEILENTSNPEKVRAFERYRRAIELTESGHFELAFSAIDHAILNDGGPTFEHVSEFRALRGLLHMGSRHNSDSGVVSPAKAQVEFLAAAKFLDPNLENAKQTRARYLTSAGLAAYATHEFDLALKHFEKALDEHPSTYIRLCAVRASLAARDKKAIVEHVESGVREDWTLIALMAADPDCAFQGKVLQAQVARTCNRILKELHEPLQAIISILGGEFDKSAKAFQSNIDKARRHTRTSARDRIYSGNVISRRARDYMSEISSGQSQLLDIKWWLERAWKANMEDNSSGEIVKLESIISMQRTHWSDVLNMAMNCKYDIKAGRIPSSMWMDEPQILDVPQDVEPRGIVSKLKSLGHQSRELKQEIENVELRNEKASITRNNILAMLTQDLIPVLEEVIVESRSNIELCEIGLKGMEIIQPQLARLGDL